MATGKKITQLTELSKAADGDWMTVVDISESNQADQNKKISKQNFLADILSEGTDNFDPWDSGTTYETANKPIYVSHNGNVWKFVSGSDDTGTEPGTDDSVWDLTSTGEFAHPPDTLQSATERGNTTDQGINITAGKLDMGNQEIESVSIVGRRGNNSQYIAFTAGGDIDFKVSDGAGGSINAINIDGGTGNVSLTTGAAVNEIVTTVDGSSTNNQLATAAAVNNRITNWSLEDARGAGDTLQGDVKQDNGQYYIDSALAFVFNNNGSTGTKSVLNASSDALGVRNNIEGRIIFDWDVNAWQVSIGDFKLNSGTTVNEIVTTIDGTSTDDQLPTAAAVNTRVDNLDLENVLLNGNDANGNDIIGLNALVSNYNSQEYFEFDQSDGGGTLTAWDDLNTVQKTVLSWSSNSITTEDIDLNVNGNDILNFSKLQGEDLAQELIFDAANDVIKLNDRISGGSSTNVFETSNPTGGKRLDFNVDIQFNNSILRAPNIPNSDPGAFAGGFYYDSNNFVKIDI